MKLGLLLASLPIYNTSGVSSDLVISAVTANSETVTPGALFVCLSGLHTSGAHFVRAARARGAAAIVCTLGMHPDAVLPTIFVPDTAEALSLLCAAFYGHPERAMQLTAVTGTNGKTSTVHFLSHIYRANDAIVASMGTVCDRIDGQTLPSTGMTTPNPEELYRRLALFRSHGATHVFLEASSHALALDKLSGISFTNGIFTNLTADHLDFHKTEHAYLAAKAKLFPACKRSFFNTDDEAGAELYTRFSVRRECFSYSLFDTDSYARAILRESYGICENRYTFCFGDKRIGRIHVPIPGEFTFYNTLAAATCAFADGISFSVIAEALATCPGIPGRLENITPPGSSYTVFVDYAHTPDALKKTISSVRATAGEKHKITVLFGCGGERDQSKRARMGEIATTLADFVYITEDNSRGEDTKDIISMICSSILHKENFMVIENREEAIAYAVSHAEEHEILLLCGKGHEKYLLRKKEKIPFSEKAIVRAAADRRKKEGRP